MNGTYQIPESTMLIIRAVGSVLQLFGILLAVFRLWFRAKIQRLWWEDAWSFIACVFAMVLLISEWMYLEGGWLVCIIGFWVYNLVLTCLIWAVRMSILFSVARIVHSTERTRRTVIGLAVLFSLIFLTFIAMKVWWFTHDLSWLEEAAFYSRPACWLPHAMYVYELCADCISYTILVSLPLYLLWNVNLHPRKRRVILAIFSSSIVVMIVSVFRAVSQIKMLWSLVGVATDLEAACSIIVCNLLVVGTLTYRFLRHDTEDDSYTTPVGSRGTTLSLTTVDFNTLDSSKDGSQLGTSGMSECDSDLSQ